MAVEDGTRRIGIEPLLQHMTMVSEKQNRIEAALGEIGFDVREVKGDLKWMREEAADVKRLARDSEQRLTVLETTFKVRPADVHAADIQRHAERLNGHTADVQRHAERLNVLEAKLHANEAAGAAEEKAAARSIGWVQWVGMAAIGLAAAIIPGCIEKLNKEAPTKHGAQKSE